jgi:predicted dehydrogenase
MTSKSKKTAGGKIRLGMVGGGEGAFIGAVHRLAARLDDRYELMAGALSSTPEKSIRSALALGIDKERAYRSFADMAKAEAGRMDGIEAVAIVTPNHLHAPVATAFLKAGIHVICDKPLTATIKEARALHKLAAKSGRIFAMTYNYTGYPMIRHARRMVENGDLGEIRLVQVEYAQDWLTQNLETSGQKQAAWRADPKQSGLGGCIGDIGTHAYHLGCFVSGLDLESLCADLTSFVKGRELDDNAHVMLRFKGGAKGMLWASQVAPGNRNNLRLRVYGTKGGLDWQQEQPDHLHWSPFGRPTQVISRGSGAANAAAARLSRIPAGHPEGYLEGFANVYGEIAQAIVAARKGTRPDREVIYPGITDGLKGVVFIEAAVKSAAKGGAWIKL